MSGVSGGKGGKGGKNWDFLKIKGAFLPGIQNLIGKSFGKDGKSFGKDGKSFGKDGKSFGKDGKGNKDGGKPKGQPLTPEEELALQEALVKKELDERMKELGERPLNEIGFHDSGRVFSHQLYGAKEVGDCIKHAFGTGGEVCYEFCWEFWNWRTQHADTDDLTEIEKVWAAMPRMKPSEPLEDLMSLINGEEEWELAEKAREDKEDKIRKRDKRRAEALQKKDVRRWWRNSIGPKWVEDGPKHVLWPSWKFSSLMFDALDISPISGDDIGCPLDLVEQETVLMLINRCDLRGGGSMWAETKGFMKGAFFRNFSDIPEFIRLFVRFWIRRGKAVFSALEEKARMDCESFEEDKSWIGFAVQLLNKVEFNREARVILYPFLQALANNFTDSVRPDKDYAPFIWFGGPSSFGTDEIIEHIEPAFKGNSYIPLAIGIAKNFKEFRHFCFGAGLSNMQKEHSDFRGKWERWDILVWKPIPEFGGADRLRVTYWGNVNMNGNDRYVPRCGRRSGDEREWGTVLSYPHAYISSVDAAQRLRLAAAREAVTRQGTTTRCFRVVGFNEQEEMEEKRGEKILKARAEKLREADQAAEEEALKRTQEKARKREKRRIKEEKEDAVLDALLGRFGSGSEGKKAVPRPEYGETEWAMTPGAQILECLRKEEAASRYEEEFVSKKEEGGQRKDPPPIGFLGS